jgi:hypothetical protein
MSVFVIIRASRMPDLLLTSVYPIDLCDSWLVNNNAECTARLTTSFTGSSGISSSASTTFSVTFSVNVEKSWKAVRKSGSCTTDCQCRPKTVRGIDVLFSHERSLFAARSLRNSIVFGCIVSSV